MSEIDDILYGIKLLNRFCRFDDSIKMMDTFLEIKQELDKTERQIFFIVYKSAIDYCRSSHRVLEKYIKRCIKDGMQDKAMQLQEYKSQLGNKIISHAQKSIEIIDYTLISQCTDPVAMAFYYKIKGDFYRYIAETSDLVNKNFGTVEGQTAYLKAIEICEQSLSPVDPVRLGTILNAAVFRYDHLKEKSDAIQMISSALHDITTNRELIKREDIMEVDSTYNTMEKNLKIWQHEDFYDIDEDDE